jgi:site-specific DNA recombinase
MTNNPTKYFIYARKSTKGREKQALSIPSQLDVLNKLVKQQNLLIVDKITERESAHVPGRPEFNQMMQRIAAGEAAGIIAWHPDRLARNSMDGGAIIHYLDVGKLTDLKFATFWFENTPQGKSNLGHEFVQTKQYSDKLACDTKRGLEEKAKMGIFPALAPRGYLNDKATKTIVVDPGLAPIVKEAFETFAKGDKTLDHMRDFFARLGILSKKRFKTAKNRGGLKLHHDWIRRFLRNPIYYGHFEYAGELYEGKHTPIISKELFDKVQGVLERRTHHIPREREPKLFAGLFRCGECGMAVTAEVQKGHTYYRCTKKSKTRKCSQKFIRAEELERQLSLMLRGYALPADWGVEMLHMAENEQEDLTRVSRAAEHEKHLEIASVNESLNRLLSIYVSQDIDRDSFLKQKEELLSKKKLLEEAFEQDERGVSRTWLEPFKEWIQTAQTLGEIAEIGSPQEKKRVASEVFGSNLFLDSKKARGDAAKPWSLLSENQSSREMVGWEGLEPSTNALKGHCSTN